ncbi:hypothetical protein [Brevundimonas sp.]|uniref:hypothetical protein n=1 Tax=Brevundimonas sp. TaxID=1871086 RepID=UPI0027317B08|nr:hypothetical protein [Brevundimonas sp.]MDP1913187.1 hypothetical protein [Brevundimonas sp.]
MGRMILSICAVVVALGLAGLQSAPNDAQADQRNHQAAQEARQSQEAPTSQSEEESAAREKAAQSERDARDLAAQESMAVSADGQLTEVAIQTWLVGWSVFLGGFALIISGVTLWITVTTTRTQLRAYLDISEVDFTRLNDTLACEDFCASFKLKNFGETPAFHVVIDGRTQRPWRDDVDVIDDRKADLPIGGITRGDSFTYQVNVKMTRQDHQRIAGGEKVIWLDVDVRYRDAFGKERATKGILDLSSDLELHIREGSHVLT